MQVGELSHRQVLEGADLAPGNQTTLGALRDAIRRPANPREPMPAELTNFVTPRVFELDEAEFNRNLRSSRRGAAAGSSGMTMEHLRPLLNDARSLHSFFLVAEQLARVQVPDGVVDLVRLGGTLGHDEHLMAFLDDTYHVSKPARVGPIYGSLENALWTNAGIRIHVGKTQIWNQADIRPPICDVLERSARAVDPTATVWRGMLPTDRQGIKLLGHPDFVARHLRSIEEHQVLLQRIPREGFTKRMDLVAFRVCSRKLFPSCCYPGSSHFARRHLRELWCGPRAGHLQGWLSLQLRPVTCSALTPICSGSWFSVACASLFLSLHVCVDVPVSLTHLAIIAHRAGAGSQWKVEAPENVQKLAGGSRT